MKEKIGVLVVDDSSIMRLLISDVLNAYEDIEVLDTATNGKEGAEKALSLRPDVILMDMVMGEYSGNYGVDQIMANSPTPIIMLSAMGNTDMAPILDAIDRGAYDYLNKPAQNNTRIRDIGSALVNMIREASKVDPSKLQLRKAPAVTHAHTFHSSLPYDAIVIGSSTGGPSAVENILSRFPKNLPIPVLIAQHMPENFIPSFAHRLNEASALQIQEARLGTIVKPQNVYIAPGNCNMILRRNESNAVVMSSTSQHYKVFNHPSIDALMQSASAVYGARVLGVLLTGMGKDGAEGMFSIKQSGGKTVAQDEETCVVFGMPKEAINRGAVDHVVPIQEMGMFLISCLA